jgi:hypothetical protein
MLSRRFEDTADATAVLVGRDPEAQITGLLKVSRANFTPIQWGRGSGSWLSHPSTLRRVKRIAAIGGVPPERLQQILGEHSALVQTSATSEQVAGQVEASEDHYALPAAKDPESVRSAVMKHNATQRRLWALWLVYLLPPTLVSLAILHAHLERTHATVAYLAGVVATALMAIFAGASLGRSGVFAGRRRVAAQLLKDKIPAPRPGDVFIGFAPAPFPRLYGTQYHWDNGFLILARNRLQFVGEQTKFSLNASDIEGITVGRGAPSWWKYRRVYVRWTDPVNNRSGVFNLYPLERCSIWSQTRQVLALYERLQSWRRNSGAYEPVRPDFADLQSPAIGQVTSISPKQLGTIKVNTKVLAQLLLLGIALSILTRAEMWYICGAVVVVRLIQCIPFWFYRESPVAFPPVRATNNSSGAPVETEQMAASISN